MINLEIKVDLHKLDKDLLAALAEQLITNAMDFAYGYDIDSDMADEIADILRDFDIPFDKTYEEDI